MLPVEFKPCQPIESETLREMLSFMLREYGYHSEIYLGPFMRSFAEFMPLFADHERKDLMNQLCELGAIRLEYRDGTPNIYQAIIVNYNHEQVRELNPG